VDRDFVVFIVYVDSSGRPYHDAENFVLAPITTNEEDWQYIDNLVKQIKINHFPYLPDENVEIHAKDMMNHNGIFKDLSSNQIFAIFDDVFNMFSATSKLLIINAVVIKKAKLKKSIEVEEWAYRLLFERLNRYLEEKIVRVSLVQITAVTIDVTVVTTFLTSVIGLFNMVFIGLTVCFLICAFLISLDGYRNTYRCC
jgi:hypothetical protein